MINDNPELLNTLQAINIDNMSVGQEIEINGTTYQKTDNGFVIKNDSDGTIYDATALKGMLGLQNEFDA